MNRRNFLKRTGQSILATAAASIVGVSLNSCVSSDDDGYYDDGYYDDGYYDD